MRLIPDDTLNPTIVAMDTVAGLAQKSSAFYQHYDSALGETADAICCHVSCFGKEAADQLGACIVKSTMLVCITILLKHFTVSRRSMVRRARDDGWVR